MAGLSLITRNRRACFRCGQNNAGRGVAEKEKGLGQGPLVIVFGVSLVTAVGNTGMISVLPALGREIGMPDALVVSIFSLSALLWAIMSPYWARESDRRGRKPLMVLGLAGFVASMIGCAIVVSIGLAGWLPPVIIFIMFLLARALFGGVGSASSPATQAFVAERSSREDRTEAMAMLAGAFGLGTIIGPAIAPLFVLPFVSFAGPMYAFALMGALMLVWCMRGLPDEEPPVQTEELPLEPQEKRSRWDAFRGDISLWRDPRVLPFLIYSFLIASCQTVQGQTLGFMIIDELGLPPIEAQGFTAVAMMAGAVGGLLGQWGFIRVFRMNPRQLLRIGAGLAMVANLITALAPDYWTVVIGYTLASLGYAFARPGFSAGLSLAVKPEEQARAAGAISAINGGNVILAPLIGILLYQMFRPAPFLMNAIILGLMLGFAFWSATLRNAGKEPATEADSAAATLERSDEGGA